jgi:hypothetical protein
MRHALTISLMVNDIDGFTEAGFAFHTGNRAGEDPGMAALIMTSRALWLTLNVHS